MQLRSCVSFLAVFGRLQRSCPAHTSSEKVVVVIEEEKGTEQEKEHAQEQVDEQEQEEGQELERATGALRPGGRR